MGEKSHNTGVNIDQTDAHQHTRIHTTSLRCIVTLTATKTQAKADVLLIGVVQQGGRLGPTVARCDSRQQGQDQEATCSLHQLGPPRLHSSVNSCVYDKIFFLRSPNKGNAS